MYANRVSSLPFWSKLSMLEVDHNYKVRSRSVSQSNKGLLFHYEFPQGVENYNCIMYHNKAPEISINSL